MSKTDEVRKAMVDAMKAKDKDTKDTLSLLLACLLYTSFYYLPIHKRFPSKEIYFQILSVTRICNQKIQSLFPDLICCLLYTSTFDQHRCLDFQKSFLCKELTCQCRRFTSHHQVSL